MKAFFKYLNGGTSTIETGKDCGNEFVKMLDNYVVGINGNEEWRQGYMKYELNLIEQYKEGKTKGFSEGIAEGESIATSRIVKNLKVLGLSDEDIAKGAAISIEQVHSILDDTISKE